MKLIDRHFSVPVRTREAIHDALVSAGIENQVVLKAWLDLNALRNAQLRADRIHAARAVGRLLDAMQDRIDQSMVVIQDIYIMAGDDGPAREAERKAAIESKRAMIDKRGHALGISIYNEYAAALNAEKPISAETAVDVGVTTALTTVAA